MRVTLLLYRDFYLGHQTGWSFSPLGQWVATSWKANAILLRSFPFPLAKKSSIAALGTVRGGEQRDSWSEREAPHCDKWSSRMSGHVPLDVRTRPAGASHLSFPLKTLEAAEPEAGTQEHGVFLMLLWRPPRSFYPAVLPCALENPIKNWPAITHQPQSHSFLGLTLPGARV